MLLLYRVEGLTEGQWETIRVCRPAYKKTETFETERYGLFRRKRQIVTDCVIHNKYEADTIAWEEALKYFHQNRNKFNRLRITATERIDGVLFTETVKPLYHAQQGL